MRVGSSAEWITVLMHRASVYRRENRIDEAESAIAESLGLARALNKPLHEMWSLIVAGEIAFMRGDTLRAIENDLETLELCRVKRHVAGEIIIRANLAGYYLGLGHNDEARLQGRTAVALGRDAESQIVLSAILHLAALEAIAGDAERAATLKGYVDAARSREELILNPTEASSYSILLAALERNLSAAEIAARTRDGTKLTKAEAAELAEGF